MKAMILAAGKGERMRPLTNTLPKPLLQVGSQSLIEHHIKRLGRAGYTELVINMGWCGEQLPKALGDGSRYGVHIDYSDETKDGPLETGGGIHRALPLLGETFVIVNGDVWTDFPFAELGAGLKPNQLAHLVLIPNPKHNPNGDFGIVDGLAVAQHHTKFTYSGIGVYHQALFNECQAGRFPLAPLLRTAMEKGQVGASLYQGDWSDIGTPQRLEELNKRLNLP